MRLPNVHSAREAIELYRGFSLLTSPYESDVTVGTTAAKLGNYANTRLAVIVSNASNTAISVGFSSKVTATTGIQVAAGATLSFNWLTDGELVMSDLYAISTSSSLAVHVVESVLSGF
jgi:hypothetical protein